MGYYRSRIQDIKFQSALLKIHKNIYLYDFINSDRQFIPCGNGTRNSLSRKLICQLCRYFHSLFYVKRTPNVIDTTIFKVRLKERGGKLEVRSIKFYQLLNFTLFGKTYLEFPQDVLRHVILRDGIHYETLVAYRTVRRPVLVAFFLKTQLALLLIQLKVHDKETV